MRSESPPEMLDAGQTGLMPSAEALPHPPRITSINEIPNRRLHALRDPVNHFPLQPYEVSGDYRPTVVRRVTQGQMLDHVHEPDGIASAA